MLIFMIEKWGEYENFYNTKEANLLLALEFLNLFERYR